ncbi:hypothetical protein AAHA92_11652 [Salvia divinorum]|uniref:Uncharacterized protein n=1 Tax=Salvia divinorum TaxID=28513 RepID=A0ABD1HHP6_SALDI
MSIAFFAYGMLKHDAFVSIPNGIGAVGMLQLVLYFHYSSADPRVSKAPLLDPYTRPNLLLVTRAEKLVAFLDATLVKFHRFFSPFVYIGVMRGGFLFVIEIKRKWKLANGVFRQSIMLRTWCVEL